MEKISEVSGETHTKDAFLTDLYAMANFASSSSLLLLLWLGFVFSLPFTLYDCNSAFSSVADTIP